MLTVVMLGQGKFLKKRRDGVGWDVPDPHAQDEKYDEFLSRFHLEIVDLNGFSTGAFDRGGKR